MAEVAYEEQHLANQTAMINNGTAFAARDMVYYRYV